MFLSAGSGYHLGQPEDWRLGPSGHARPGGHGGVRRGTHVLKALSLGAKAVSGGRLYLYALAAAGQAGVERALGLLEAEIVRDMKLMGKTSVAQLTRENLRFR